MTTTLNPKGKFAARCHTVVQNGGGPGSPTNLFTLDTAAWRPDTFTDPAGGNLIVWTCRALVNCEDAVSGLTYWRGQFRFVRTPGPGLSGLIWYSDSTSGLTFSLAFTGTTCKLQVAESVGHTVNVDGIVHYEAHY
jgi:hypothetical protein